ncbi:hypothetical protein AB0J71_16430 [Nonomuraea sp. NPDC049637]|uniref:hypothetical protein n=1 Tax=Nonomuraea sp. NPDC049637 TaxID=3154356 RepID=UPI00343F0A29
MRAWCCGQFRSNQDILALITAGSAVLGDQPSRRASSVSTRPISNWLPVTVRCVTSWKSSLPPATQVM